MNKLLLKSQIANRWDTQAFLAEAMGLSLSRLNAKINGTGGAEFTQTEIAFISERYKLSGSETMRIFFSEKVS